MFDHVLKMADNLEQLLFYSLPPFVERLKSYVHVKGGCKQSRCLQMRKMKKNNAHPHSHRQPLKCQQDD